MNAHDKSMQARFSLSFGPHRRAAIAATRYALTPDSTVSTVECDGLRILYNPDWALANSEPTIADAIVAAVRPHITGEVDAQIDAILANA